ncbi:hypothetical protein CYMTET_52889 [Cymbomonas tetramitiformis]|uniref:Uncharacterized protein n=1 Tax=Cymbomonas tetramitiformis TaxID=36881 RepID=A0AAE0ER59_9CHLO|nr:hypothetical protein CYMTET_52889 [Cymbomonas tetramitiformis]
MEMRNIAGPADPKKPGSPRADAAAPIVLPAYYGPEGMKHPSSPPNRQRNWGDTSAPRRRVQQTIRTAGAKLASHILEVEPMTSKLVSSSAAKIDCCTSRSMAIYELAWSLVGEKRSRSLVLP